MITAFLDDIFFKRLRVREGHKKLIKTQNNLLIQRMLWVKAIFLELVAILGINRKLNSRYWILCREIYTSEQGDFSIWQKVLRHVLFPIQSPLLLISKEQGDLCVILSSLETVFLCFLLCNLWLLLRTGEFSCLLRNRVCAKGSELTSLSLGVKSHE